MKHRVESIDIVRGIAMVLMALDHTRDFFGVPADPTNLATASSVLFLTRWVTHLCAPTFFLLTGVGAGLACANRTKAAVSRDLALRGVWLIALELVVVRCAVYQFNVDYQVTFLLVLWALGWSMILLSALVWAGPAAAGLIGVLLVVDHNAFDGVRGGVWWMVLHRPGVVWRGGGHMVFAAYPLVPWVGVAALGFATAALYVAGREPESRQTVLRRAGLAAMCAFVLLRWVNAYGDPSRWKPANTWLFTVLSFLNTTKYPPSLLYLLMTLGPALVLLALAERAHGRWTGPLIVLGRVPLFYYALHFFLLHVLAVVAALAWYGDAHWMIASPDLAHYPFTTPPGWGFPLPVVYGVWMSVVLATWPLCAWFGRVKARRPGSWLRFV